MLKAYSGYPTERKFAFGLQPKRKVFTIKNNVFKSKNRVFTFNKWVFKAKK